MTGVGAGDSAGARRRATDSAAEWLARRDAGWRPGECEAFEAWLAAAPAHRTAVAELERTLTFMARPRTKFSAEVMTTLVARDRQQAKRRRQLCALAAGIALAAGVGWIRRDADETPGPAVAASERVTPRPHRQVLEDGSVVELNSHAVVEVDFSPALRRVVLRRGIAHFAVAKDTSRPFVVSVGRTTVRAVGTAFTVEVAPTSVEVLVAEGKVDVGTVTGAAEAVAPVRLEAGLRASVPVSGAEVGRAEVSQATPDEIVRAQAWRVKRVEMSGMPLAEAVALFNRQNDIKLEVADAAAAAIKVSGICWIDNPRAFARMVEATFGIRIEERAPDRLVLRFGGAIQP